MRDEYIKCIAGKKLNGCKASLCGRYTVFDFVFVDAEHARLNEEKEGRLITCPECKEKVKVEALAA